MWIKETGVRSIYLQSISSRILYNIHIGNRTSIAIDIHEFAMICGESEQKENETGPRVSTKSIENNLNNYMNAMHSDENDAKFDDWTMNNFAFKWLKHGWPCHACQNGCDSAAHNWKIRKKKTHILRFLDFLKSKSFLFTLQIQWNERACGDCLDTLHIYWIYFAAMCVCVCRLRMWFTRILADWRYFEIYIQETSSRLVTLPTHYKLLLNICVNMSLSLCIFLCSAQFIRSDFGSYCLLSGHTISSMNQWNSYDDLYQRLYDVHDIK